MLGRVWSPYWERLAAGLGLAVMGALFLPPLAGAEGAENPDAAKLVKDALRQQVQGVASGRAELLQAALLEAPHYGPARWQSGFVKHRNQWVKYDQVSQQPDTLRQSYRWRRAKAPLTPQAQLELAAWCEKRKLYEEARAHWTKVLELDGDNATARAKLGFRRVEGVWLSAAEIAAARQRAVRASQAMEKWKPKLDKLYAGLSSSSKSRREQARAEIVAIDDPDAIGAIEAVLSSGGEAEALLAVKALGGMTAYEGTISLARHAVFASSVFVRHAAVLELIKRKDESYIPVLLAAMRTPVQSRAAIYRDPRGRLMYSHAFYREGQDMNELALLETRYRRMEIPGGDGRDTLGRAINDARRTALAREAAVARQNAVTQAVNERIGSILTVTTGQPASTTPEIWWVWWNEHNDVFVMGEKPLRQIHSQDQVAIADRSPSMGMMTCDCLAAGTPVWTAQGLVAIDKVQVGDLVLSQHPETGELAYKPVLRTTVRPEGRLMKINLRDDESIETSGGHPFWQIGHGWIKARDVAKGMRLHGPEGTRQVASVETAGFERTYNLVVADFHTYFVGKSRVLSHDNTLSQPTNALIPGFDGRK